MVATETNIKASVYPCFTGRDVPLKELKSQDELAVMDGGKCILQLRGVRPFFSDKYDITRHKQYHLLSDDDPKQEFNIEKYVSDQREMRLRLASSDSFTDYGVDVTAGQEENPAAATEKEKAEAEADNSETDGGDDLFAVLSGSEETE